MCVYYCVHNQLVCIQHYQKANTLAGSALILTVLSATQCLRRVFQESSAPLLFRNPFLSHVRLVLSQYFLVFTLYIHIRVQLLIVHLGGYLYIHAERSIRYFFERKQKNLVYIVVNIYCICIAISLLIASL